MSEKLDISPAQLTGFCQRWRIVELGLFGSILRDDFTDTSDIDFLVAFEDEATWSLFDVMAMKDELTVLVGRNIDVVERRAVERSRNPVRRRAILDHQQTLYAA